MVGHQAISVDADTEFLVGFPQTIEKKAAIVIGKKDGLFLVASGENMVESAWILDPQLSCQGFGSFIRIPS
jgi:hypothetical protein